MGQGVLSPRSCKCRLDTRNQGLLRPALHEGRAAQIPKGIPVQRTPTVQAAGQIRFGSLAEVDRQKPTIRAYLREAHAVEKSGARVVMKTVACPALSIDHSAEP